MLRQGAVLTVGVALALIVSGCTSGSAGSASEAPEPRSVIEASGEAIPDAGSISGTVIDDTLAPVPGAQVAVLELSLTAIADEGGAFAFTNLAAGTYKLAAQALGYESQAKSVTVAAAAEAPVQFLLAKIEIKEFYAEILGPVPWFFDCRVGTPVLTGPCGVTTPDDKSSMTFKMTEDVEAFVGEMRWQPGTFATSKQLRMSFSYQGRPSTHWYCTDTSPTPVFWHYTMEDGCLTEPYCGTGASQGTTGAHSKPNTDETLLVYTNTPFGCPSDPTHVVELSLQQKLEAALTLFHNGPMPEGWTLLKDA